MITLATLPTAAAQEVFNQSARHLLKQDEICTDWDGAATFTNNIGQRCAVGALMSEEEAERMTEATIDDDQNWPAYVAAGYAPTEHAALIEDLRCVHDGDPRAEWPARLAAVAVKYGLVTP